MNYQIINHNVELVLHNNTGSFKKSKLYIDYSDQI